MDADHWHFARPQLAQAYLSTFELGLSSARGLFARRRMGKTEFLLKDFIPAAQQASYLTAYVNLWDNRTEPARALIGACYQAIEPKGVDKWLAKLKNPVKKLRASGKLAHLGEASVEAELDAEKTHTPASLLSELLQRFDQQTKRLILVIDEAQVLARAGNDDFAHALRAALDVRKSNIKVLFAGSSESTLRQMFGRPDEPFYNWAALEPFQLLDEAFVTFMVDQVAAISRHPLLLADALGAFEQLRRTPEFFRRYLERYVTHPFDGPEAALDYTKAHVFNEENFQQQWDALLPADRALLQLVAADTADLHGQAARTRLGERLGMEGPAERSTVQNALRRLNGKNLLTRMSHGRYQFEDEAFAEWIETTTKS